MSVIAVYNMKGGVGKTTAAVNLAYLAAAGGQRVLLWDLDPQAAASFAFRVRPRVAGFSRESLKSGEAFATAIKETDYDNLDVLPADFAYRKLDRLLGELGKPARVVTALLATLGGDYDAVFLDCPAGFSLVTEGIFAAADMVLVPTIPTVLSLRMVARIIKSADRCDSPSELASFFSMVDRRKALHRRACDWPAGRPDVFLNGQVPYASVVEQMTVRRAPLPVFAARDAATSAFAEIWAELQTRLQQRGEGRRARDRWSTYLGPIESLIAQLESPGQQEPAATSSAPAVGERGVHFIHGFDTDDRDLQKCGYVLELHERSGSLTVVAARPGDQGPEGNRRALAEIDRCWAVEILSGAISPLAALARRLGAPRPRLVEHLVAIVGGRRLRRIGSRAMGHGPDKEQAENPLAGSAIPPAARLAEPRLHAR
ncbi:MAG TPA: ParA family protein [Solirubrobacteraceae bacterium]|nr:ParA family protein [Solirubrobacteraceae bacterium]